MIGLRRLVFHALPKSSASLSCRTRAFNTATAFTTRTKIHPLPLSLSQRRYASEEAQTQSEPPADRAEEGQHGDNSIAASSQNSQAPAQEQSAADSAANPTASEQSSASQPARNDQPSTVGEYASAAAEKTREAASSAYGALSDFASHTRDAAPPRRPDPPPSQTVYVGNLFFDVREADLRREFEKIGTVENIKMIMDNRGLSKGFGYITFASQETAAAAIQSHHNQPFEGRRLTVQYANGPRSGTGSSFGLHAARSSAPSPPSRTLFIGNMAFDMSDRELNDLFREIRNVVDVRVAIDRRTGQPRGFAHADFTDVESAKEAMVVLAGKEVCGRTLRVDYSQGSGRVGRRDDAGGAGAGGEGQQQRQEGY